jgi:hypothetical protein
MNRERYLTEIGQSTGSDPSDGVGCGLLPGRLRMGVGKGRGWERLRTPVGEGGWERQNVTTENELLA